MATNKIMTPDEYFKKITKEDKDVIQNMNSYLLGPGLLTHL
jgi:hypothetical protein